MNRRLRFFLVTALSVLIGPTVAAADCALGKRYLELAQKSAAAYAADEEREFLRKSIDACPSYDAYERLGELGAQSPEPEELEQAVQAFVAAHELAPDDKARARSLYQYSKLLQISGDPQNAYPLIKEARALDSSDAEIRGLERQLEAQIQNPSQEQIVRGLRSSLFKPLKVASTSRSGSRSVPAPVRSSGPSINIPINFETGSTMVDVGTRPNLVLLARALADPTLQGKSFIFIGHADIRGEDTRNVTLSRDRAAAIYDDIVLLEPSIAGRVEIVGRGSAEPLDTGRSEQAYQANRRLQVLVK